MASILSSNVTIMVSDMDAAIQFYTDVLGFKLKNRYGDHWADIEAPGLAIGLHPANKDIKIGDSLSIGLKVSNLDEAMAYYTSKGISFKAMDDAQVRLGYFSDPSGNSLYLVEEKW